MPAGLAGAVLARGIEAVEHRREILLDVVEVEVLLVHLGVAVFAVPLQAVVLVGAGSRAGVTLPGALRWEDLLRNDPSAAPPALRMAFDAPLFILYSSGTTGKPKSIVHGTGGTLLQHRKEHLLHTDIRPGDRVFYFTTCGWMMWNWLVSALASNFRHSG